jgi:hypothetical protein
MAFCANLSNPKIKQEFDTLVSKYGERAARYVWNAREEAREASANREVINTKAAKQWLNERGLDATFYDFAGLSTMKDSIWYLELCLVKIKEMIYITKLLKCMESLLQKRLLLYKACSQ